MHCFSTWGKISEDFISTSEFVGVLHCFLWGQTPGHVVPWFAGSNLWMFHFSKLTNLYIANVWMEYWRGDVRHGQDIAQRNVLRLGGKYSCCFDWWWTKYDQTVPGCCNLFRKCFGEHVVEGTVLCPPAWPSDGRDLQNFCEIPVLLCHERLHIVTCLAGENNYRHGQYFPTCCQSLVIEVQGEKLVKAALRAAQGTHLRRKIHSWHHTHQSFGECGFLKCNFLLWQLRFNPRRFRACPLSPDNNVQIWKRLC